MRIEPFARHQLDALIGLSIRAWAPVFEGIEKVMDSDVYLMLHPDWRVSQTRAVEEVCTAQNANVWVAIEEDSVVGFVSVKLHSAVLAEIYMIAVDPACQRRGFGTALVNFAVDWMRENKVSVAMIDTGGDPGHAPARRAYERSGFRQLPIARYLRKL